MSNCVTVGLERTPKQQSAQKIEADSGDGNPSAAPAVF